MTNTGPSTQDADEVEDELEEEGGNSEADSLRTEVEDALNEADDAINDAIESLDKLKSALPPGDSRVEAERWHRRLVLDNPVSEILSELDEDSDDDDDENDPEKQVNVIALTRRELRAAYKLAHHIKDMALITQVLTPEEGIGFGTYLNQLETTLRQMGD